MLVLALALIVGLVGMHALTQEGAVADVKVTAWSDEKSATTGEAVAAASVGCSVCSHVAAPGSADLWTAALACLMLVLVAMWRCRERAPVIGLRLPFRAAPEVASLPQSTRAMSLDLLSLCVLRT